MVSATYEKSLSDFMTKVYNNLILGMVLSGITAYLSISSGLTQHLSQIGILLWIALLSPFALVFIVVSNENRRLVRLSYYSLTIFMGLSISVIFNSYTSGSVISAFVITSIAFSSLSIWGYTTKKALNGWGNFLLMSLVGLIVAMIVSLFIASSIVNMIISIAAVIVFAGLIAYDTQAIKNSFNSNMSENQINNLAINSALNLYLNFINMFIHILRIFGVTVNDD